MEWGGRGPAPHTDRQTDRQTHMSGKKNAQMVHLVRRMNARKPVVILTDYPGQSLNNEAIYSSTYLSDPLYLWEGKCHVKDTLAIISKFS